MISSDFRAEARRKLDGKWGEVALTILAYLAVFFLLGFVQGLFEENSYMHSLVSLGTTVIQIPLTFGLIISLFKVYKGEASDAFSFFSLGFSNFGKAWGITFKIFVKLIVPIILMVVSYVMIAYVIISTFAVSLFTFTAQTTSSLALSAVTGGNMVILVVGFILLVVSEILLITQSYYYKLAYVVAADDESLTAKDAVEKSKELMNGKRGKLFCLELSFIGWAILASLTFGIGYLWLLPYIQFATFAFYFFVSGKDVNTVETQKVSE